MTASPGPLRRRGRPMGEVGVALLQAAKGGPGTVVQLAERACVGYGAARYTASRLVSAGALVPLTAGRPAVLGAVPDQPADPPAGGLRALPRSFWEHVRHRSDDDDDEDDDQAALATASGLRALPRSFWQVVTAEMRRRREEEGEDDAMVT